MGERCVAAASLSRARYDLHLARRLSRGREETPARHDGVTRPTKTEEHCAARARVCVTVRRPAGLAPTAPGSTATAQTLAPTIASGGIARVAGECRGPRTLLLCALPCRLAPAR